jgi:SRSO17 transposase
MGGLHVPGDERKAHQQPKEELGLDHFEGRSWHGLHRHALTTMIADSYGDDWTD